MSIPVDLSGGAPTRVSPLVEPYLGSIVAAYGAPAGPLVSLVLFGSAATGGYAAPISDVDLLLVLDDGAGTAERRRVRSGVEELETRHGLGKARTGDGGILARALAAFADRITANVRSFFICTRADLLSGDPARVLDLPPAQARFVDRVAVPSIVGSGRTVWGEELLHRVPLPPIRRLDVAKSFFGLFNQALFSAAVFPLLPGATRYAMDAMKRSVHSCYFCYHAAPAPLTVEIAFLDARLGSGETLARLLELRRDYRRSLRFVLGCLPTLVRLHWRTARDLPFPRAARPAVDA